MATPTPPPTNQLTLVTDLMFDAKSEFDQDALVTALADALGGEDALAKKQLIDADMLDPRQEMQISPSRPFRRRDERRLMILDEALPMPELDPEADGVIAIDFRPHRDALIAICRALPIRLGRIFILGAGGDAVLVARNALDLRAVSLLPWVLDPQADVEGRRRSSRLTQQEFEAKLMTYELRLEELGEKDILARISGASFSRLAIDPNEPTHELLVVDNLNEDGSWDTRRSFVTEAQLAAVDRFSMLPGAPSQPPDAASKAPRPSTPPPAPVAAPAPVVPKGPPLRTAELGGQVVLVFPEGRFDLEVASALGKRDWDSIVQGGDPLTGSQRDRMHQDGAGWIAPLEFLSEVFVEGKPLSKSAFEQAALTSDDGMRVMPVHFPRFGPVTLLDIPGTGRFVTSLPNDHAAVAKLVRA